mmetsp:Transcript_26769/g.68822  ORF Transcript_26769/g.68822 Transcript_26769/m.68822 type:complete len:154 (-) Transcript_26769:57-518(-)
MSKKPIIYKHETIRRRQNLTLKHIALLPPIVLPSKSGIDKRNKHHTAEADHILPICSFQFDAFMSYDLVSNVIINQPTSENIVREMFRPCHVVKDWVKLAVYKLFEPTALYQPGMRTLEKYTCSSIGTANKLRRKAKKYTGTWVARRRSVSEK